jgi:hypothetical protein
MKCPFINEPTEAPATELNPWNKRLVDLIQVLDGKDLSVVSLKYVPHYAETSAEQPYVNALVFTALDKDKVKL